MVPEGWLRALVLLSLLFVMVAGEMLREDLIIQPLDGDHVLSLYHYEMVFKTTNGEEFGTFPKPLGQALYRYQPRSLEFALTQGRWYAYKWGTQYLDAFPATRRPPELANVWTQPMPTGGYLKAHFDEDQVPAKHENEHPSDGILTAERKWQGLARSLSALFCSSFGTAAHTKTHRVFEPALLDSENVESDRRLTEAPTSGGVWKRVARLDREPVCTENLSSWLSLLPCLHRRGPAATLHSTKVFGLPYVSLTGASRTTNDALGATVFHVTFDFAMVVPIHDIISPAAPVYSVGNECTNTTCFALQEANKSQSSVKLTRFSLTESWLAPADSGIGAGICPHFSSTTVWLRLSEAWCTLSQMQNVCESLRSSRSTDAEPQSSSPLQDALFLPESIPSKTWSADKGIWLAYSPEMTDGVYVGLDAFAMLNRQGRNADMLTLTQTVQQRHDRLAPLKPVYKSPLEIRKDIANVGDLRGRSYLTLTLHGIRGVRTPLLVRISDSLPAYVGKVYLASLKVTFDDLTLPIESACVLPHPSIQEEAPSDAFNFAASAECNMINQRLTSALGRMVKLRLGDHRPIVAYLKVVPSMPLPTRTGNHIPIASPPMYHRPFAASPTTWQLYLILPPGLFDPDSLSGSSTPKIVVSIDFERVLAPVSSYPPDISRGVDVSPASVELYEVHDHPDGSTHLGRSTATLWSNGALVYIPYPDATMPFNVIAIVSSIVSFFFGSLFNLLFSSDAELGFVRTLGLSIWEKLRGRV